MTTTVDQAVLDLIALRTDVRDFVEAVLVIVLVVTLVQVEALRRRPGASPHRGSVTAIAAVLGIAWMMVVTQRFFDLLL